MPVDPKVNPVGALHEWALKHRGAKYKAAFAETAIKDREGLLDIMIADRQTHATTFGDVRPKKILSRAIAAARMYAKLTSGQGSLPDTTSSLREQLKASEERVAELEKETGTKEDFLEFMEVRLAKKEGENMSLRETVAALEKEVVELRDTKAELNEAKASHSDLRTQIDLDAKWDVVDTVDCGPEKEMEPQPDN